MGAMTESKTRKGNDPQPGYASQQDTSPFAREIQRRLLLLLPTFLEIDHKGREFLRRVSGAPHRIDFFHQVDDPYSELALQAIAALQKRYRVEFQFHLVSQTDRVHAPEPELLSDYARRDCGWVAPYYDLEFPRKTDRPRDETVRRVEAVLAGLTHDSRFVDIALVAGRALWHGDTTALAKLEGKVPVASAAETRQAIDAGNTLRQQRRHYSGAMFWYAGEWYWGVDRLHHLERRLTELGAARGTPTAPRFDRPEIDAGSVQNVSSLQLEIFPSLRSPYTAMIFERSMQMAHQVGVPVMIRPVMPMVMRGVPAPAAKGIYIMLDALREADHIGVPFGNMLDPIGRPVERAFSLWPFANQRGRGEEFLAEFLRAAFVLGQATGTDRGLARIVEKAGLSFEEATRHLDRDEWRAELEANRQLMYDELGLWGVPSYRLRGPGGEPDLCVWGQDRLWLVAAEIRRRLAGEPLPADAGLNPVDR
jgi:2-hydroxychromene-2-carboxylate isomerase